MSSLRVSALLLTTALAFGCSGSDPDPGDGDSDSADVAGDGIALEDLDEALGAAYCDRMFGVEACCAKEDLGQIFPAELLKPEDLPTDVASCKKYYAKNGMLVPHLIDSVAAGRVTYDAKAAKECVAQIQSSCEFGTEVSDPLFQAASFWIGISLPSFCEGVVTPKTGAKDCLESIDCAEGKFCLRPPVECQQQPDGTIDCTGTAPPGKCTARAKLGASCENKQCAEGLSCPFFAEDRKCEKPLADGERCVIGNECASAHCGEKTDLNETGVCAAPPIFCGGPSAD